MIGEDGTLIVGVGKKAVETIIEHIGILGMFVKNKAGNLDVANLTV